MHADPETVARRLIEEGFNNGDLGVCDEVTAPDLVEHQNFGPGHAAGAEGVRADTWSAGVTSSIISLWTLRQTGKIAASDQHQAHCYRRHDGRSGKASELSGHSQQIDDISFVFERPRIGLHEAMIDCNLADLIEFVFTDADISEAAR